MQNNTDGTIVMSPQSNQQTYQPTNKKSQLIFQNSTLKSKLPWQHLQRLQALCFEPVRVPILLLLVLEWLSIFHDIFFFCTLNTSCLLRKVVFSCKESRKSRLLIYNSNKSGVHIHQRVMDRFVRIIDILNWCAIEILQQVLRGTFDLFWMPTQKI